MKRIVPALLATLLGGLITHNANAQPPPRYNIETRSKWVNSNLEISVLKNTPGTYTVYFYLTRAENIRQSRPFTTIVRGDRVLVTLTPIIENQRMDVSYNYRYARGYHDPKLDTAFVYRLPYSIQKGEVMALAHYNLRERHFEGGSASKNWASFQFQLERGDTIFAARKGLVVEVRNDVEALPEDMATNYHSTSNQIVVEQNDGTIVYYDVFEKGSITVKPGDIIFPGTPLGKAGAFYENGDYQIRFWISYPELQNDYRTNTDNPSFEWTYINPMFLTDKGVVQLTHGSRHQAVTSPELEQKEMTKKELKSSAGQ